MNTSIQILFVILSSALIRSAFAVDFELGFENRYFISDGVLGQNRYHPSIRGEAEYSSSLGDSQYEILLFGRYDIEDSKRTHADVRELHWLYIGNLWEIKTGISKEFWGVTESAHLVDIINQSDSVENIDNEDKLGQPMVKASIESDLGTFDTYLLPYFRERRFNNESGRFIQPLEIDYGSTFYESSANEWHTDFAFRYSHYIGDIEFAISHFSGTSREPLLTFNGDLTNPKLIPNYFTIDQTGIEFQYIWGDTLVKLEGISRSGFGERYTAAVAGFEYTQVGIFDMRYDLGWLMEYLFDDRKEAATTPFEQDIFFGWRLALNDADSSEILAGVIWDPETAEKLVSVEASKRLSSNLKIEFEARIFAGTNSQSDDLASILSSLGDLSGEQKTVFLQNEDYLGLEVIYYF